MTNGGAVKVMEEVSEDAQLSSLGERALVVGCNS